MASPQLAEQKAEVKETELPKEKPNEDEDPDRIVTENEIKKPKEDDPKIAAVQTQASRSRSRRKRPRGRSLDEKAPEAEKARAPNLGIGKDKQQAHRRMGPADQRLFRAAQALSQGEEEQDGDGQAQPGAEPAR